MPYSIDVVINNGNPRIYLDVLTKCLIPPVIYHYINGIRHLVSTSKYILGFPVIYHYINGIRHLVSTSKYILGFR
jgi:succinate dehydrogenase/fumarate reductase cytochrome b subunit